MKDHSVSQPIAPPATIPIEVQPSADALMTDWLAERVTRAIDIVINEARPLNVQVRKIHVFGHESVEELTRVIFILPEFDASDQDAYAYWGVLAEAFYRLNQQPPPNASNNDVTIEVFIFS